jgi:hypothetical protein
VFVLNHQGYCVEPKHKPNFLANKNNSYLMRQVFGILNYASSPLMMSLFKKAINKLSCFRFQAMLTAWTEPFNMDMFTPRSRCALEIVEGEWQLFFEMVLNEHAKTMGGTLELLKHLWQE